MLTRKPCFGATERLNTAAYCELLSINENIAMGRVDYQEVAH